jgi:hypothetical protein
MERILGDPPAGRGRGDPGQRIHHRIQIGADGQSEKLEIIGDVDHHGKIFRRKDTRQAVRQLRAPHPSGQRDNF